LGFKKNNLA